MDIRKVVGFLVIVLGCLILLNNFDFLDLNSTFFISLLMILVGGLCFYFYLKKEHSIWLLIISFVTFFWGFGILVYELGFLSFYLKNHFILLGIGLSFIAVYFHNTKQWWAIIPGGCILVVFIVNMLDEIFYLQRGIPAFLLFFGIGLIFLYLYLISDENNRLNWAFYPAIVLILFGLFQLYFATRDASIQIAIAAVLILLGILLVIRAIRYKVQIDLPEDHTQKEGESELQIR